MNVRSSKPQSDVHHVAFGTGWGTHKSLGLADSGSSLQEHHLQSEASDPDLTSRKVSSFKHKQSASA